MFVMARGGIVRLYVLILLASLLAKVTRRVGRRGGFEASNRLIGFLMAGRLAPSCRCRVVSNVVPLALVDTARGLGGTVSRALVCD